jgi:hypothetical protein
MLHAEDVIGNYIPVAEQQITTVKPEATMAEEAVDTQSQMTPELYPVPDHLKMLYLDACRSCSSMGECQEMAKSIGETCRRKDDQS